ncbi:MAG: extracellular solute-binding protein [Armatimonadetes bacterium]|nr:extracellular solute-binding protein [Armatimonadota bacterium]
MIRIAFRSLLLLTLSVCASAFGAQDVVIWGDSYGPDSKGTEAVVNEFVRLHPEYRVRLSGMGAGKRDPQKLMTSIVGNVAPDVIVQDRFAVGDWASRGAFLPLDGLIARDSGQDPFCPQPKQYYAPAWQEGTYQGHIYSIPTGADDRVLYWNRGVFHEKAKELRAAGLDPERAPRTWDELLAYSRVLTEFDSAGNLTRAGFIPNFGNSWLYMFAFQNNAPLMSADGRTCTLDNPFAVEALQFMVDGYKLLGGYEKASAFQAAYPGGLNDAFMVGKVAMKIDGDWTLDDLMRYGRGVDLGTDPAPVPADRYNHVGRFKDEKDTFVTWSGGFCLAIPRGARNPDGGWEYIKFATSLRGRIVDAQAQYDWNVKRGHVYMPRMAAQIAANEWILKNLTPKDPKFAKALATHAEMMRHARTRPVTFVGQRLWAEHARAIENACLGRMTPKDALADGRRIVQGELDAYFDREKHPLVDMRLPQFMFMGVLAAGIATLVGAYKRAKLSAVGRHEARWGYLMIAPWLLGFVLFTLGPMLASLFFSFTEYSVLQPARWVGAQNYADMFTTDKVLVTKALFNAAYLAGMGVPLGVMTGLAVALLMNSAVRGIRVYRTMFYLPAIVPTVAAAILWKWILNGDPNSGLVNGAWSGTITHWLGLAAPPWIGSETWAKPALIVMGLWGAGSGMIMWLAGLKGVPSTLYEAAALDGASPGRQFFNITIPQLTPLIFFNLVMGVIGAVQDFDRIYVMRPSDDGPVGVGDSMITPVYHLFANGFAYFKMGYASALAWMLFLIILGLTLIQWRLRKQWVFQEVED